MPCCCTHGSICQPGPHQAGACCRQQVPAAREGVHNPCKRSPQQALPVLLQDSWRVHAVHALRQPVLLLRQGAAPWQRALLEHSRCQLLLCDCDLSRAREVSRSAPPATSHAACRQRLASALRRSQHVVGALFSSSSHLYRQPVRLVNWTRKQDCCVPAYRPGDSGPGLRGRRWLLVSPQAAAGSAGTRAHPQQPSAQAWQRCPPSPSLPWQWPCMRTDQSCAPPARCTA